MLLVNAGEIELETELSLEIDPAKMQRKRALWGIEASETW